VQDDVSDQAKAPAEATVTPSADTTAPSSTKTAATASADTYSLQEYLDDLLHLFTSPRQFMGVRACEGSMAKAFLFVFISTLLGSIGFGLAQREFVMTTVFWLASILTNYLTGFFFHLVFKLFGGGAEWKDSLRACNYTIAPCLFQGVPYVSPFAALYSAVLLVFGMRAAHKVSLLKAALVVGVLTACFFALVWYMPQTFRAAAPK